MIKVVDMTIGHLIEFRENVREMDLEEILVASGKPFDRHIISSLEGCKALVDSADGVVLGIGGVDNHIVWLVCTKAVENRKIKFLRFSKQYLKYLIETHGYIGNAAYLKNTLHIQYLNWMGVTWIGTPETDGPLKGMQGFIIDGLKEVT